MMQIRSWAGGLMLFGLFYAAIIVALFVWQWPSMQHPNINLTLENKLSQESLARIHLVKKTGVDEIPEDGPDYVVKPASYTMQAPESSISLDTVLMINGHLIVFKPETSRQSIDDVAKQYAGVLLEHQIVETTNTIIRLIFTLFIPLVTIGLFAWAGNKLWRALENMR